MSTGEAIFQNLSAITGSRRSYMPMLCSAPTVMTLALSAYKARHLCLPTNFIMQLLNARATFESVDREVHRRSQTSMYLSFATVDQERSQTETFRSRLSRIRHSFARERDYSDLDETVVPGRSTSISRSPT